MSEFQFIEWIQGEPHYRVDGEGYTAHVPIVNVFEKYFIEEKSPRRISQEIDELGKKDVHRIEAFWTTGGFEETENLYEDFKEFNARFDEEGPEGFIQEEPDLNLEGGASESLGKLEEVYDFFYKMTNYDHIDRTDISRLESDLTVNMSLEGFSTRIDVEEIDSGYKVSSNLEGDLLTEFRVDENNLEEKVREVYNSVYFALID